MRVIAGRYKGRNLKTLKGDNTRPTTSKNKENLFNIIGPYFEEEFVLDLFSGSGALGIEALSRGGQEGYFVDSTYQAYKIIEENLKVLKIENAHLYKMDAFKALKQFSHKLIKFDLVFLDPPYKKNFGYKALIALVDLDLLNTNARVVVEELKEAELPDEYKGIQLIKKVVYGISAFSVYQYNKEDV